MVYAYIRVSTDQQSSLGQEYEINNWCASQHVKVDVWVRESVSGTVLAEKRKLGRVIRRMRKGDLLVCSEISRLGRSILMVMSILNDCAQRGIAIHSIKDNFDLGNNINSKIIAFAFALAAEIERNLISQRTKEALAGKRASGMILGRPSGHTRKYKMIRDNLPEIEKLLKSGASKTEVAASFGIHRNTFAKYLKSLKTGL